MVSSLSPSVSSMRFDYPRFLVLLCLYIDTVDQILARTNDAGQFDELETVWMLSA